MAERGALTLAGFDRRGVLAIAGCWPWRALALVGWGALAEPGVVLAVADGEQGGGPAWRRPCLCLGFAKIYPKAQSGSVAPIIF